VGGGDNRYNPSPCWATLTGDAEGTVNYMNAVDATGMDRNGGHTHVITGHGGYSNSAPDVSDPVFHIQTRTKEFGSHEVFMVICRK